MKKLTIAALLAASFGMSAVQAAGFDGLYVGADATSNTAKLDVTSPGVLVSTGEGSRQLGFGINLGYGKTFGNFYLAGEAAYAVNQGETGTTPASLTSNGVTDNGNLSGKARNVRSLSILPGFVVSKDALIYARLGKGVMDAEVNFYGTKGTTSYTGDIDIITKGIGMEYKFNPAMSFRAEFNVSDGDTIAASGQKYTVSSNSLMAGVNYRF